MGKRTSSAMIKLKKQPKGYTFQDPTIPLRSRKYNAVKPTKQMLDLVAAAVSRGEVRHVAPAKKLQGIIANDAAVIAARWGYQGFGIVK